MSLVQLMSGNNLESGLLLVCGVVAQLEALPDMAFGGSPFSFVKVYTSHPIQAFGLITGGDDSVSPQHTFGIAAIVLCSPCRTSDKSPAQASSRSC